ncbi:MAG: histone deacetylase family protein, partial [Candidatus Kariarchaeaceae archaeon]
LCRPPGHHAFPSMGGGYCFFNNMAIAAKMIRSQGKTVSILDLDYHHGNGTQEIFYETAEVQFVSIHADPQFAYPFFWGGAEEIGEGDGLGYNVNIPISPLATEDEYTVALDIAIDQIAEYNPDVLLVSMGFDSYINDTIAGMRISSDYYTTIGQSLAPFPKIGIILEGGYHIDIGTCFRNLLNGLEID